MYTGNLQVIKHNWMLVLVFLPSKDWCLKSPAFAWFYLKLGGHHSGSLIQVSTIPFRFGFSNAAATLSLSLICLFTETTRSVKYTETWTLWSCCLTFFLRAVLAFSYDDIEFDSVDDGFTYLGAQAESDQAGQRTVRHCGVETNPNQISLSILQRLYPHWIVIDDV